MDNSPLRALFLFCNLIFFLSKVSLKLNKYCVQIHNNRKLTLTKRLKTCQVLQRSKEIEDINCKKKIWCIKFSSYYSFYNYSLHIECYFSLVEANLFPTHSVILRTKLIKSSVLRGVNGKSKLFKSFMLSSVSFGYCVTNSSSEALLWILAHRYNIHNRPVCGPSMHLVSWITSKPVRVK